MERAGSRGTGGESGPGRERGVAGAGTGGSVAGKAHPKLHLSEINLKLGIKYSIPNCIFLHPLLKIVQL